MSKSHSAQPEPPDHDHEALRRSEDGNPTGDKNEVPTGDTSDAENENPTGGKNESRSEAEISTGNDDGTPIGAE